MHHRLLISNSIHGRFYSQFTTLASSTAPFLHPTTSTPFPLNSKSPQIRSIDPQIPLPSCSNQRIVQVSGSFEPDRAEPSCVLSSKDQFRDWIAERLRDSRCRDEARRLGLEVMKRRVINSDSRMRRLFGGGGSMDLSKVGERILSSVRSLLALGLLGSSSAEDWPEVPARAAAATAVARALASVPPHQRLNLPCRSEELSSIYGIKPLGEVVDELEEDLCEEDRSQKGFHGLLMEIFVRYSFVKISC